MKKTVYIIAFTFLGILLQLLVHALIEMWYIHGLLRNFKTYSLGFTWAQWFQIHMIYSVILFVLGAIFGLWQGFYWWKKIYEKKRSKKS